LATRGRNGVTQASTRFARRFPQTAWQGSAGRGRRKKRRDRPVGAVRARWGAPCSLGRRPTIPRFQAPRSAGEKRGARNGTNIEVAGHGMVCSGATRPAPVNAVDGRTDKASSLHAAERSDRRAGDQNFYGVCVDSEATREGVFRRPARCFSEGRPNCRSLALFMEGHRPTVGCWRNSMF